MEDADVGRCLSLGVAAVAVCLAAGPTLADVPKVREERPRLVLRAKAWDGPSVEKTKTWMTRPEYRNFIGPKEADDYLRAATQPAAP